jgi:RNA 2',3'-cyclic 3'-phosphodiesterase
MPRLFTALEIPPEMRMRLSLLRSPLDGAKWIDPDNMHITLRFAGDIDERTADEFADLLGDIRARPFPLTIREVGSFGGRDPHALWAGVDGGGEALAALHRAHERAARAVGLEADTRIFKPHVTLARLRRARQHAIARFLAEHGSLRLEPFTVTRFVLLSARSHSGGPPYVVEAAYPFEGEAMHEVADLADDGSS